MAMTKCKDCRNEISTTADICPNCGAKVKRTGCFTMTLAIVFGLFILSVVLGSCEPGEDQDAGDASKPAQGKATAPRASTGNQSNDALLKLSDSERNSTLTKFMVGESCGTVTRSFYQGVNNGDAFWSVECRNGSSYAVQIKPDAKGSTSILDCGVMKAVAGVECFKRWQ